MMPGHIVAGADDSLGGRAAVAWALQEADLRQATLQVLFAWTLPWSEGFNTEWSADRDALDEQARTMLADIVADAKKDESSVTTPMLAVVEGVGAARALIEVSADADLLVVGSRGRGGFVGLALGSVSTACVHHARCPVVVVRPERPPSATAP